jgi:hypothetical protein
MQPLTHRYGFYSAKANKIGDREVEERSDQPEMA